jgi:hypothetical protein
MRRSLLTSLLLVVVLLSGVVWSQTTATGAIVGTVTDPEGKVVQGASVVLVDQGTGIRRESRTDASGVCRFSLLPPGQYSAEFGAPGFATIKKAGITVNVSETTSVNTTMQIGARKDVIEVTAETVGVSTETSSIGRLISPQEINEIPLTNRNYTQILHLSPGVAGNLTNAAELGRNSQEIIVHGSQVRDNNYHMDGAEINNPGSSLAGNYNGFGGIPIPSPDAIQEFNVQTGQYDAGSGRSVGANVNVVTKSGTNSFHGTLFEYFRNDVLNANDYFLNAAHQPRASMKQNQFGFVLGGPIKHNKLFFFASYQGTRQVSGLGKSSLGSVYLPAELTNDRSQAGLGAAFAGQRGLFQTLFGGVGPAILANGSNINPAALKLLQLKNPNGSYYIPTPQRVSGGSGVATFSLPSHFLEDQMIANIDYAVSPKHMLSGRWFSSWDNQTTGFPLQSQMPTLTAVPGNGQRWPINNYSTILKLTSTLSNVLVNEVRVNYVRNTSNQLGSAAVTAAQVGITGTNSELPNILMPGMFSLGDDLANGGFITRSQGLGAADQIAWSRGKQNIRVGVEFARSYTTMSVPGLFRGLLIIPSFADLLLGLPGCAAGGCAPNTTTDIPFSNILASIGAAGIWPRRYHANDWSFFFQDDYKVHPQLTLNLGIRWEIKSPFSEANGLMANFIPSLATATVPAGGTYSGFLVPHNYPGTPPVGVTRSGSNFVTDGTPLSEFAPRVGLAWRPFAKSHSLVVHAGYGIFYNRNSAEGTYSTSTAQPYLRLQILSATTNSLASLQQPFIPALPPESAFPMWSPRTPTSNLSQVTMDPNIHSPMTQQWSLNMQYEMKGGVLLEVGYVGSHAIRVLEGDQPNEAQLASPANPINGQTTSTLANIGLRVPFQGFSPGGLQGRRYDGQSSYNGLEATIRKRLSHGLQLQASYTFSKTLNNQRTNVAGATFSERMANDGRGLAEFSRPQRFVLSYLYEFPNFHGSKGGLGKLLGGWSVSGVTTFQSGNPLTVIDTRAGTIYGADGSDAWFLPANFCSGASNSSLVTHGSVQSRLNGYINAAAICAPPTIGDGTGFGNIGRGVLRGPGQNNWDISIAKVTKVKGPTEATNLEFRAQFFNAFNHPQFANPALDASSPSFGTITSTSVSPRLIQFALKYNF